MSEERQLPQYDPEITPDPIATGIAIGRASPAIDSEVIAFLRDQRLHLHEQFRHLREQLRLRLWEQRMGVFLRVATAIVGVAVASGAALMVWDAAHSKGLIIEPFNVPPDMAARGLSGQVVATQMLDRLTALQDATDSSRAPQSYANNWGDNIKVEIPDTGVSIGELQRFLKGWLGHDTHITGEVYHTATGIAVTARAGTDTGATFTGAETELQALVEKAAEHVYGDTQPYRYANFLDRDFSPAGLVQRRTRAEAIYQQLSLGPDIQERAWAINGLGTLAASFPGKGNRVAADYYRKAITVWPDFTIGHYALAYREYFLDRRESELRDFRTALRLLHQGSIPDVHPKALPLVQGEAAGMAAALTGDCAAAIPIFKTVADTHITFANGSYILGQLDALVCLENQHNPGGARAYMRDLGITTPPPDYRDVLIAAGQQDWPAVLAAWEQMGAARRARSPREAPLAVAPVALARAHLGDTKGAQALIANTLPDCEGCLLARAQIAQMQGQNARADWWFARAAARTPSIPFADFEWGAALLQRGQPDNAIEKFKLSSQKGPHFADPLEGWGEALMLQNRSDLALAKFEEAARYAPNWGRLHLKWGEAAHYAGNDAEAKKQFAIAATLFLTPSEESELGRAKHG